jgi:excisionase family DNA binding protein
MPKNDDPLLTVDEVSTRLNVPRGTLYRWRHYGNEGPVSIKVGSAVRYRESAVEAYLKRQEQTTARGVA